jgi:3-mercaptopyruvate sulfurtransferase SseA
MAMGYTNVWVLEGGWPAWEKNGYPVEPKGNEEEE